MGMETLPRDEHLAAMRLLEPWTLLPSQQTPGAARLPEQELMLAVLREAIDEYREAVFRPSKAVRRRTLALRRWFSSEDVQWPFSFRNLCEALDIDRAELRARLVAWRVGTAKMETQQGRARLGNRSMRGTRTKVVG